MKNPGDPFELHTLTEAEGGGWLINFPEASGLYVLLNSIFCLSL